LAKSIRTTLRWQEIRLNPRALETNRPLRIHLADGLYHVTARGDRRAMGKRMAWHQLNGLDQAFVIQRILCNLVNGRLFRPLRVNLAGGLLGSISRSSGSEAHRYVRRLSAEGRLPKNVVRC
jgi:hypothetical protein